MLLSKADELTGWGRERALDTGRLGTSPSPASLAGCPRPVSCSFLSLRREDLITVRTWRDAWRLVSFRHRVSQ